MCIIAWLKTEDFTFIVVSMMIKKHNLRMYSRIDIFRLDH